MDFLWAPDDDADPPRVVAFHEAGHAVMNVLRGRPLGEVSIRSGDDHAGRTATFVLEPPLVDAAGNFKPPATLTSEQERAITDFLLIMVSGAVGESWAADSRTSADALVRNERPKGSLAEAVKQSNVSQTLS